MNAAMEPVPSALAIRFAQKSEAGRKPENQDTVGARIPTGTELATKGIAIAIADGVSSSEAARQASQTAITGFLSDYYATPDTWRTGQSANRVLQSLNRYLWSQSQNSVRQEGYLTTFSLLILKGDKAFVFHVGDSRIYRLRQGSLERLTRDHCQQIDRHTTYLSRALGADLTLEVDMQSFEICAGDLYLLSTDGLHDVLDDKTLTQMLTAQNDLESLAESLYRAAMTAGSEDNTSLQLAGIDSTGTPTQDDAMSALSRLPFPPLLNPGQTLDGLKVEKSLHESERSQVYKVTTAAGTPLVMKTPSVNYEDDPAYIERFVMEGWIGARVNNRHLVRTVMPPQERSCLYYLTEYIAGPTLTQLLAERAPLPVTDAVELMEQIIAGVRALHRKDTLHQDLKPDNIVVGSEGACIVDYGSCYVAGLQEVGSGIQRDKILGTLDYSAPEYRTGGNISQRADQFSLAVIFYEMLTGKHPYGDAYARARTAKHFQALRYHSALKFNPLVPAWLDRALQKALNLHPTGRYPALSEWLQDCKRPNPAWLQPKHQPMMERHPEKVWKILAISGWLATLALAIWTIGIAPGKW